MHETSAELSIVQDSIYEVASLESEEHELRDVNYLPALGCLFLKGVLCNCEDLLSLIYLV